MKGLTADPGGLDHCRRVILDQAGQFGGIADGFSSRGGCGSAFGTLPAAGRLADLARQVDEAAGHQFAAAETFLRGVERGLDSVRQGVTDAEDANVRAIQAI